MDRAPARDVRYDAMSRDPLLQPLRIKGVEFKNRIMSTSHACGLEERGMPTARYQAYHEEKARGGLALTMFGGSSNVSPDSPSIFRQLDVGTDEIIPHLARFSERVHQHGAALMCQITHLGRRGDPHAGLHLSTVGPSAVRETLHRSIPKIMDEHDIARIVADYAAAARRCERGGLDGIEVIGSSHLIGQFLSPETNRRTDRYGGSEKNRCRFAMRVLEAIREAVSERFIVGFRFVVDEASAHGLDFDASVRLAERFERSGFLDFFNALYGRMDTYRALAVDNMPGMASPIGPWLSAAGAFRRAVGLPVFHAARITDLATARYAIETGLLDMVAMTRAHIADPHLVSKLERGEETRVRPCVGATHCMSDQRPSCLHNPASGRELELPQVPVPAPHPKSVVVVGGGPAGLEAARILGGRGHRVVLYEAQPALGGQLRLACRASWRKDLVGVIEWRVAELESLDVTVHTSAWADLGTVLAHEPDYVIVATGGMPMFDMGEGEVHCASTWDFLARTTARGAAETIVIYDGTGRHGAITAAEHAHALGYDVELVCLDDHFGMELAYAEQVSWKRRAYELGLSIRFDERLVSVVPAGNALTATFVNELTGKSREVIASEVVVDQGTAAHDALFQALAPISTNDGVTEIEGLVGTGPLARDRNEDKTFELHRLGDAVSSRNVHAALLDANRVCHRL